MAVLTVNLRAARGRLTMGFGGQAHEIYVSARTAHLPQPLTDTVVPLPRTLGICLRLAAQGPRAFAVPGFAPQLDNVAGRCPGAGAS